MEGSWMLSIQNEQSEFIGETARKLRQGVRFDHWEKTYPVKDPRFTK